MPVFRRASQIRGTPGGGTGEGGGVPTTADLSAAFTQRPDEALPITDDVFDSYMEYGDWMILFHAPWCPHCTSYAPEWHKFSNLVKEKRVPLGVATVDVTRSPALSARFIITSLPAIF